MFTGIVQGCAVLQQRITQGETQHWRIGADNTELFAGLQQGASVAINGCCVTAVNQGPDWMAFDLVTETLLRTHFGALAPGARLNVERSLHFGDEVGGHILAGHIHCCAVLEHREGTVMTFRIPSTWVKYLFSKGFIGLAGCSLTLGEVEDDCFKVHLIPETLRLTNLGELQAGDAVNVEFEQTTVAVVETVERVLSQRGH